MLHRSRAVVNVLCLFVFCCTTSRPASAGDIVGWRTDGTGKYPSANPPTVWAKDKGIVWKTPLPSWSNASPILVGDRLFVCSEPDTLLCINAVDGTILWQKTHGIYADIITAEQAAQVKEARAQGVELRKQHAASQKELDALGAQLKQRPDDAALKASLAEKKKECDRIRHVIEHDIDAVVSKWSQPPSHGDNGYSTPTPVSDGKYVYVLFTTGVAACYDLEGNRKWIKRVENPAFCYGYSSSPLLCGDKLLVHLHSLTALSTATGQVLWNAQVSTRFGTSLIVTVGGEPVMLAPDGTLVRVSDGKIIAKGFADWDIVCCCSSPVVEAGVAYLTDKYFVRAVRLPVQIPETLKWEPLWESKRNATGKGWYYASPAVHDGLVYLTGPHNTGTLTVLDAATGQMVYERKLQFGGFCWLYPSVTLAGKHLFASSETGVTFVFEPGREYKEIARNTLERFDSTPIFNGKRMYVRARNNMYCIGE